MKRDDWQVGGRTTYPAEYAEWLAMADRAALLLADDADPDGAREEDGAAAGESVRPRIVAPLDGDRFELPPGVDARFATIPLAAAPAAGVTWRVDGQPFARARWTPRPGRHVISAAWPDGQADSVVVVIGSVAGRR
jgi:hypothetical protein